jgi:hypothetical protein
MESNDQANNKSVSAMEIHGTEVRIEVDYREKDL